MNPDTRIAVGTVRLRLSVTCHLILHSDACAQTRHIFWHFPWPRQNDQAALATSIMESTLVIQDGMGEKMALSVQFVSSFVFGVTTAL